MKALAMLLAALLAAPLLLGPAPAPAADDVKIALVAPLSGRWARQGQLKKMGAEMAIAEINAMVGPASPDKAGAGKKLLATVSGTLWAGFILTLILYVGLVMIFPRA